MSTCAMIRTRSVPSSDLLVATLPHRHGRRRVRGILTALTLLLALQPSAAAQGPVFHVSPAGRDLNNGSAARPWRTIGHADSAVTPGATVLVAPGDYPAVQTRQGGIATARIRYVSTTRWGAVISGTDDRLWDNRGDYVDIEGFDVTGPEARIGIVNWGKGGRIIGNRVRDIAKSQCLPNAGGAGILHSPKATDSDMIGNVVINIGPPRTMPCNLVQGLYHSAKGGKIQNNLVFGTRVYGIHLYHAADGPMVITNNLVVGSGRSGVIIGGTTGGGAGDNILVANNILVDNREYGISEGSVSGAHNRYLNNLFFGNGARDYALRTGTLLGGSINADPRFVNYRSDGSGDYRLRAGSPAIDAGTNDGAPATDFDGVTRPQGAGIDVGPFERREP